MLPDDARLWLRDLVALPEEDAAREISARFLGVHEAAYRAGASEMAPTVRDAERDAVVRYLERVGAERLAISIGADVHREGM